MKPFRLSSFVFLPIAALLAPPLHAAERAAAPGLAASQREAEDSGDALEKLRQRLAEKLGATKAPGAATGNDLRIPTRPETRAEPERHLAMARPVRSTRVVAPLPPSRVVNWDYVGEGGPQAWGQLKPEFSVCGSGQRQSPIDIHNGISVDLTPLQFDYRPSAFSVTDTGRTIQVNVAGGNYLSVGNRRWQLVGFDFHLPAEDHIGGRGFDMEMDLLHQDGEGHLLMLALMLQRGSTQNVVQTIWNNLPLERNQSSAGLGSIDLSQMLPVDRRYYNYMGSLTAPPCTEGVEWVVLNQPVGVSQQQIDIFAHLYPMNARPIQRADGRLIKQSQ